MDAEVMPTLKPCPFCGGAGKLIQTPTVGWVARANGWAIQCAQCMVRMPGATSVTSAVEDWNARVLAALNDQGKPA